jgi:mycothiol synthase
VEAITLRGATADDLEAMCALLQRSEAHDGVPRVIELDEMREEVDDVHVVLATDVRLARRAGELAGFAYSVYLPSAVRHERCYLWGEVDPLHRGLGVGRTLLGWTVERATEQLRGSGNDVAKFIRVHRFDYLESAHRLFRRMGFTPARYFDELICPLVDLPDPAAVAGVTIVPWPDDRDDEIRAVAASAFADHWGSTPSTPESWHQQVHGFGARPDLSFVAIDDASGEVVSFCLNKRYPAGGAVTGREEGWIDQLGTRAEWRRRGLASQLIVASLHALSAEGLTHAILSVDSDNPTDATRMYRRLGFEHLQRSIDCEIALDA